MFISLSPFIILIIIYSYFTKTKNLKCNSFIKQKRNQNLQKNQ